MTPRERIDSGDTIQILMPWPPSVNGYWRSIIRGVGKNAYAVQILSADAREYIETAYRACYSQSLIDLFDDRRVSLDMHFHPKRRGCDIDNFTKGLFDAMSKAKVWKDDKQVIVANKRFRKPISGGLIVLYARLANQDDLDMLETTEVDPAASSGLW
jgi:crossover junction endodeoxyribonuclease RusA